MREATPHLTIRHSHHLGCLHLRQSPLHDLVDDPQPLYPPYAHRDHVLFHPALLWNAFTLKRELGAILSTGHYHVASTGLPIPIDTLFRIQYT